MLQDLGKVKEVNILDSGDTLIDPATDQKLDELKVLLQAIDVNTDELELKAENINLNTDDLEAKLDILHSDLTSPLDVNIQDGAGNDLTSSSFTGGKQALDVNVINQIEDFTGEVGILDTEDVRITPAKENTLVEVRDAIGLETGENLLTKLQAIIDKNIAQETGGNLDDIKLNTDNLDIALSTIATEITSQSILDTIGQETGETILSRLEDVTNKLSILFGNNTGEGIGRVKLFDGEYEGEITADKRLKVDAVLTQETGIENIVQIEDGLGTGHRVKVDESNRFHVATPPPTAPPDTTPVITTGYSDVSGSVDEIYVVPNGETLIVQRLSGGAEKDSSFGSAIELWYDPNGTGLGMTIIDVIFANGSSDQHDLYQVVIGDGTKTIRMRRRRFSGGSKWTFGRWEGYY